MAGTRDGDIDAQAMLDAFAVATEHAGLVVSIDGVVTAASREAQRLFGRDALALVGRHLSEIEGAEAGPAIERRLQRLGDGRVEETTSCIAASGERVSTRVCMSPIRDGGSRIVAVLVAYCVQSRDLRASAALDALLEHIPEGITIADAPDVVIHRVSRYGLEIVQRSLGELSEIAAETHPEAWQVYDVEGTRLLAVDELPLTRAVKNGEVVHNEAVSLRRPDGSFLPILCNAGPIRGPSGDITGGVIAWRDISDLREAERQRMLLLREMHHRVKNAFALTNSLVTMVGRESTSVADVVDKLHERIGALARAQELVRFELETSLDGIDAGLHALVATVIKPFLGDHDDLVSISGPSLNVESAGVPHLALVLTELVTNAVKHGALSVPGGSIAVAWTRSEDRLIVEWTENAPGLEISKPTTEGFGSKLLAGSVRSLRGELHFDWRASGLVARMSLPSELVS